MTNLKASIFPSSRCDATRCAEKTLLVIKAATLKSRQLFRCHWMEGFHPVLLLSLPVCNYDSPWKGRSHSFGTRFLLSLTFSPSAMLASATGTLSAKKSRPFKQKYAQCWLQEFCSLQGHSGIFVLPQIKQICLGLLSFFVGLLLR